VSGHAGPVRFVVEVVVVGNRETIAAEVADLLVNRLFGAGLALHVALGSSPTEPVRARIEAALIEIDAAIQVIRVAAAPFDVPFDGGDSAPPV
jgi:hypothetical protein